MGSVNTSLSNRRSPSQQRDEDGDYPFIYTVRAGISKAALERASILSKGRKGSKHSLSYVVSLTSSCHSHLAEKMLYGPLERLRAECEDSLAYRENRDTFDKRPVTFLETINDTFQIPLTQQWWLWGVSKEFPDEKDAVNLAGCGDVLEYIEKFTNHAKRHPDDKSRSVMHLVIELSRDQPRLFTFETNTTQENAPKLFPVEEYHSPTKQAPGRLENKPADEDRKPRFERRRRNSDRQVKDLPEPKLFQRRREERQQRRETLENTKSTSKGKEPSRRLPPRRAPSTRKEEPLSRAPSPPPRAPSPPPRTPSPPPCAPSPPPRTPSPPPPAPSPPVCPPSQSPLPIEPLIPQDSLNDDSICAPNTLLRHMDTSSKPGNVTQLIPLTASPSEEQWYRYCQLLGLDPEKHRDSNARSIHIPGTKIWATPRQYRTALHMLKRQTYFDMPGGYLADEPGTGKTYTVMVYLLLRALIFHSKDAVESSSPKKHKVSGNVCSCNNAVGIQCYAIRDGVTWSLIKGGLVSGPALLQTEPTVLEAWTRAFCDAKLSNTFYHPVLFSPMVSNTPRELAIPANLTKEMGCSASAKHSTVREYKDSKCKEIHVDQCSFSFNKRRGLDRPVERYIFLTTYSAAQLKRHFQIPVLCKEKQSGLTVYGCPVGVHIIDEHHKENSINSNSVKLAFSHKELYAKLHPTEKNTFTFWAVSGTPFPNERLNDLKACMQVLERPEWNDPKHRNYHRRPALLPGLEILRGTAALGSPTDRIDFEMRLNEFCGPVEASLFIRHLNPNAVRPTRVSFVTPAFHVPMQFLTCVARNRLEEYIRRDPTKTGWTHQSASVMNEGFAALRIMRMLSSFPSLAADLDNDNSEVSLQLRRCQDPEFMKDEVLAVISEGKKDVTAISPVSQIWRTAMLQSPKFDFVFRLIGVMDRDETMRGPEPESASDSQSSKSRCGYVPSVDLSIKKLVVVTPDILESLIYYAALRARRPDCKPLLLHGRMSSKERKNLLNKWNSLEKSSCRILVTTFDASGTGINLQVANYQVLTSPLRLTSQEEQCFGRTNRAGQRLPLHQYLLISEDNVYDRLMMANRAGIDLPNAFDVGGSWVTESEEFKGYNYGKGNMYGRQER